MGQSLGTHLIWVIQHQKALMAYTASNNTKQIMPKSLHSTQRTPSKKSLSQKTIHRSLGNHEYRIAKARYCK